MNEIKNTGSGQIFDTPVLETLTKSSPYVSIGIYLSIIVGFLIWGYIEQAVDTFLQGAAIFALAFLSWTLFEYLFHRFVNHLDSYFPESEAIRKFDYAIHGIHHEYPRDTSRLIMPPVPGIIIICMLLGSFWLVMGVHVLVFMPGFLLGYLSYAFIHYATHAWKPPKSRFLKNLWRHHALHHYKHPDKAFGVSTPLWDIVFRTLPPENKKNTSEMV